MNAIELEICSILLISFQALLEGKPPPFSFACPVLAADGCVCAESGEAGSAVQGASLLLLRSQAPSSQRNLPF